jgi:UDP-glucose:(heptosyl)LPS alpha-1,3-glucosyltransferase
VTIVSYPPRDVTIVAHDIGPIGGMERQLSELIKGLLDRGFRVTAISRRCDISAEPALRQIRVPGPARPFALGYLVFLALGTWQVWRHRAGLVHASGAIVANHIDICTIHFCHRASRRRRADALRMQPIFRRTYRAISRTIAWVGELLLYRPSRIRRFIAVSPGVADELRRCFPAIAEAVSVIPNAVDQHVFRPDAVDRGRVRNALGLTDSHCAVLFVGGDWERKGLRIAIQAVAAVERCHLVVVGAGNAESFMRRTPDLARFTRVHFTGPTHEVAAFYASADVFILPSAYETFSIATYEAAASGLPLLVTRVNGVEDILKDGENGWFIGRDPATIAPRLSVLQKDRLLRRRMGARSREMVATYTWSRVVDSYVELYARAMLCG